LTVPAGSRGKKKATAIDEDDPEKRELIPKVTWSVTRDKVVRELLEVRHLVARLPPPNSDVLIF
jgi:hypothetical protein